MRILQASVVKGVALYLYAQFTKIRGILQTAGVQFAGIHRLARFGKDI